MANVRVKNDITVPPMETRLIEVAIDLFGQDGPNNVGTRAIAEAAGAQMSAII
jgi:AcrR family transcriptional regulator